uniref:Response regulator receiver protein n=2 Tax=Gloeothece TaxID=28070 RepID=E0UG10_GLOV7|nr:response regulator receiver protein [Gloeothece verrucosa PCC 7822]
MFAEVEDLTARKLLMVDDDLAICEVVKGALEDLAGWEVMTINSPQQGLVEVVRQQIDALILDLRMPQIDGLAFLRELKQNPNNPSIPVILLTAETGLPNGGCLAQLGVVGVIGKPFNAILLHRQIMALLGWA